MQKFFPPLLANRLNPNSATRPRSFFLPLLKDMTAITLIELMCVVVIISAIGGIGITVYRSRQDEMRTNQAISDILELGVRLDRYNAERGVYPNTLAQLGANIRPDPWGQAYGYVMVPKPPAVCNQCRKDKFLHPINTDYDLYSMGVDGKSAKPITAQPSQDDIIRINDGAYIGLVSKYQ
jgi:general secretion pathway protein G